MNLKPLLVKLGEALYLHAKQREQAEKAERAVTYLQEAGLFNPQN